MTGADDKRVKTALDETRLLILGAQILLGFCIFIIIGCLLVWGALNGTTVRRASLHNAAELERKVKAACGWKTAGRPKPLLRPPRSSITTSTSPMRAARSRTP